MKKVASRKQISDAPTTDQPAPRKKGRPATGRMRTDQMVLRFTEAERSAIEAAAENAGIPPTVWVRNVIIQKISQ